MDRAAGQHRGFSHSSSNPLINASRVLVVSDFHGGLDTVGFLKFYGGRRRREETEGDIPIQNRQAVKRILDLDHYQVAVLSYIGAHSTKKRNDCVNAVRDLNHYLRDRACSKRVGLLICDHASEKARIIEQVRAAAFIDDKLLTCQQTVAAAEPTDVYFEAERRPRDDRVYHVRSFAEFADCVMRSRHVPIDDSPPWLGTFPLP